MIGTVKSSPKIGFGSIDSFSQLFEDHDFSVRDTGIHFWELGDNTKQWLLNRKYPKSIEIISKNPETSYIYKLYLMMICKRP